VSFEFDGLYNFRDLGGLSLGGNRVTRRKSLYRSDALDRVSGRDRDYLLCDAGVRVVIDLRTAEEADGDGLQDRRMFPELETHHMSLMPEGRIGREPFPDGRDPEALAQGYARNLAESAPTIGKILEIVAICVDNRMAVLFHCAAGRDRTGLLAAVLLELVGVRRGEIVADFLRSNRHAHHIAQRLDENPLYRGTAPPGVKPAMLHARTMECFLDGIVDDYGSVEVWALEAGVPRSTVDAIRAGLVQTK
jgi:protein tyrosine/serine phosphatase